jgi:very-short-patch-repair endonuclease
MNYPEQRLWKELRKLDAHIRRQASIGRYVADFACPSRKVVIEVEGGVHERLPEVALRDIERTAWLEGQGYTVLRFSDVQVLNNLDDDVDAVRLALALPLDGGGLGGGEAKASAAKLTLGSAPTVASSARAVHTPPSPTLPPSRGKGDEIA